MTTQIIDPWRSKKTDGVKIIRVPVAARISKGVIAPTFGLVATNPGRDDVVQMHLPQFDAAGVALRGRSLASPPCSPITAIAAWILHRLLRVVDFQNNMAGMLSNCTALHRMMNTTSHRSSA